MITYAENRIKHQIGTEHVELNDEITIKRKIRTDLLSIDEVNEKTITKLQNPCRISTDLNIGRFIRSGSKQSPTIHSKFHLRSLRSNQILPINYNSSTIQLRQNRSSAKIMQSEQYTEINVNREQNVNFHSKIN